MCCKAPPSSRSLNLICILMPSDVPKVLLRLSFPWPSFLSLTCIFQDVKVLYKQLAGSHLEELDVPIGTGLDDILEKIRIHWEKDIERNRAETGALLYTKVSGDTSLYLSNCKIYWKKSSSSIQNFLS